MWTHFEVEKDQSFQGDSGTATIPIPRSAAIGDIILTVRNKNGSTNNSADGATQATINSSITEIKVVSGNRVLWESTGQQCHDWLTYRTGRCPLSDEDQRIGGTYPSGYQESVYTLPFGRFPGDESVGIAAPLLGSLSLKLKYDFKINSISGFATGEALRDVFVDYMDPWKTTEELHAMRTMETRKLRDYTTVSSGEEPFSFTLDPVRQLRQVMVTSYTTNVAEGVDITDVEFLVDNKAVISKIDWNNLQYTNANDCKLSYVKTIKEIHSTATTYNHRSLIPNVMPIFTTSDTGSEDAYITTTGDDVIITMGNAENGVLEMRSDVIPRCVFLDFDKNLSMRNLVNRNVLDLTLKLTNGSASGAVSVHEQSIAPAV